MNDLSYPLIFKALRLDSTTCKLALFCAIPPLPASGRPRITSLHRARHCEEPRDEAISTLVPQLALSSSSPTEFCRVGCAHRSPGRQIGSVFPHALTAPLLLNPFWHHQLSMILLNPNWLCFARFTPRPRHAARRRPLPTYPSPPKFGFVLHNSLRQPPPAWRNLVRFAHLPSARAKLGLFCRISSALQARKLAPSCT